MYSPCTANRGGASGSCASKGLGCLYELGVTHQVLTGWGVGPVLLIRREVVTWWENCSNVPSVQIIS